MPTKLTLLLNPDHLRVFLPLMQQGVQVDAQVGCDIQSLLCDQFKLRPDYLAERITTIFLDGKPVDDVGSALVRDGATLALSTAMPGLVGATFRKTGSLASFRDSITYRPEETGAVTCKDGFITLKLFNMLMPELGPLFLERGVWISGRALQERLNVCRWELPLISGQIATDGRRREFTQMMALKAIVPEARLGLRVRCESKAIPDTVV